MVTFVFKTHNIYYLIFDCDRQVRMSHTCKVEMSHCPVEQAGLEFGCGMGCDERVRAEPD